MAGLFRLDGKRNGRPSACDLPSEVLRRLLERQHHIGGKGPAIAADLEGDAAVTHR